MNRRNEAWHLRRTAHGEMAAAEDASARLVTGAVSALAVEQYRRLAATLHDAQVNTSLKTVMITSAVPHEGKTLTTLNLALTLTDSYAREVLIVDADLRWPCMHSLLGVSNTRGLTDALTDKHIELPVLRISDRLHLLTAGRPVSTPLARLSSSLAWLSCLMSAAVASSGCWWTRRRLAFCRTHICWPVRSVPSSS